MTILPKNKLLMAVLFFIIPNEINATEMATKQEAIIVEEINKNPPVLPYNYSEKQYENFFKNNPVDLTQNLIVKKPTVLPTKPEIKPIDVKLSTFWEGLATQTLKISANTETNLGRGGYAVVKIDSVLNGKGENVYDKEDTFGKNIFLQKLFRDTMQEDAASISDERKVHLKKDTKESDIKSINGTIHLYLPINPKIVNISKGDIGKTKEITPDLQFKVEKFGTTDQKIYTMKDGITKIEQQKIGEVVISATGKNSNLLLDNFYSYNSKDLLLAKNIGSGRSGSENNLTISWTIKGTPATAQIIIAEKFFEKEYPFTITK